MNFSENQSAVGVKEGASERSLSQTLTSASALSGTLSRRDDCSAASRTLLVTGRKATLTKVVPLY